MNHKIVFIDRDGVINEDPIGDYVKKWEDFRFLPGSIRALKKLTEAGFGIVIISNQAGIGDGVYSEQALKEITDNMIAKLEKNEIMIRGIYYCLHGKDANCDCRKPKTGLFQQAARDIPFSPQSTYFVGDKISDIQAGKKFGLRTLLVLTGHGGMDQLRMNEHDQPERIFASLMEAVEHILIGYQT